MPKVKRAATKANDRGRPAVHTEAWTKVTVVLLDRQIVYLDRLATDIRATTRAAISRAEIIRALIDGLAESTVDVSTIATEADLKKKIASTLTR